MDQDKPGSLHGVIILSLGAILVVFVPVAFCYATPDARYDGSLAIVVMATAGMRLAYIVGSGTRNLVETTVWIFTYVFLGAAPLVQLRSGVFPDTTPGLAVSLFQLGLVAVLVGAIAFAAGYYLSKTRPAATKPASVPEVNRGRALVLSLGAVLAGLYFIVKVGVGTLFASRSGLDSALTAVWPNPLVSVMVRAFVSMTLLVAFVAIIKARDASGGKGFALLRWAVVAVLLVAVNPISSPRYVFGTVAFGIITVLGAYATRGRARATGIAVLSALVLLFPLADAFRYGSTAEFKSDSPVNALTTGDFDAFGQLTNTLMYLQAKGTTDGQQLLGVVFFWVPRDVWSSKPVDTGILLANFRGYSFTNLSAPLQAELLINGSWIALIAGMFALGWFARRADVQIQNALALSRSPGVLGCILPGYMFLILRGSLLQAMAYFAVILGAGWFVQTRQRPTREVPQNRLRADKRKVAR
jgi:hypothetical protein